MICFDTMVLIWGVQGEAAPGQEEMVARTRRYITSLNDENERIMIPTPALTEYLQGFDAAERKQQLKALEKNFFIPSFNLPAAYLAAGLARRVQESRIKSKDASRQEIKTDIQIIATAIVNSASRIITNNTNDFEKLAELAGGRIQISDIPDIHEQQGLDL